MDTDSEKAMNQALHRLMYGLLYPAALGAGIVALAVKVMSLRSGWGAMLDPALQLGVLYCVVFSASYVASYPPEAYNPAAFLLDLVETGLIVVGLFLLGYLTGTNSNVRIGAAYLLLAAATSLQLFWRVSVRRPWKRQAWLRGIVVLLLVLGACLGERHYWFNVGVMISGVTATIAYVRRPEWLAEQGKGTAAAAQPLGEAGDQTEEADVNPGSPD